ncbi:hypothetical protein JHJ32_00700 [Parapedobacter sp. ISTM3]|uniref:Lipoprotein n=1 Tax=Parapedobacter luteus TaxID=623280 RepID=A0A1T5DAF5_9SPHI|nr:MULTISPECIES: hypothetical protein [Parapedobacter]MBK1438491.1 hypothetical protein [Parapedobacter sp. ISTM3]SKB68639.1 hypothetical protein SAMN05660226_02654 [Parapedobacter luteus]
MKTLILATICLALLSCTHTPPRGDDPVRRDSVGDSIHPLDTSVNRLDPDSVTDTPEVRF